MPTYKVSLSLAGRFEVIEIEDGKPDLVLHDSGTKAGAQEWLREHVGLLADSDLDARLRAGKPENS